jgi:putative CocE/NonD family hydrolase
VDPAKWCAWDYAVISVDARGAGASEGNVAIMGTQEGEDGYDVIEAVAKMEWCDGNVALAGNSHLAIVQWFIAAQNPPSLKAIAPWEGCSDLYVSTEVARRDRFGQNIADTPDGPARDSANNSSVAGSSI